MRNAFFRNAFLRNAFFRNAFLRNAFLRNMTLISISSQNILISFLKDYYLILDYYFFSSSFLNFINYKSYFLLKYVFLSNFKFIFFTLLSSLLINLTIIFLNNFHIIYAIRAFIILFPCYIWQKIFGSIWPIYFYFTYAIHLLSIIVCIYDIVA